MRISTGVLAILALAGCGGGDGPAAPDAAGDDPVDVPDYRPPVLTAVQPPTVSVGSAAFVLDAEGTLDADAVVLLDGVTLTTRVISATALEADVPAELLAAPQLRFVQVLHTGDGGGLSGSRPLAVVDGVAPPVLDELVPASLLVGNAAAPIQVSGWNFRPTSVVTWDGEARPTTFVSSALLTAAIPATDLDEVGSADVAVVTPDAAPADAPLVFTIDPLPVNSIGVEGLASVTITDTAGGGVGGSLSADGRYVAFESLSPDLVAGDGNSLKDVFVRDTCRGAAGCTPSTIRGSVDIAGGDANGASSIAAISGTGRYVAFMSGASDLVSGATSGVFVRDTCLGAAGCTPTTILASLLPDDGSVASYGASRRLTISQSGRFVAFDSNVPTLGDQVFLSDTCLGVVAACTPRVELVSRTLDGLTTSTGSGWPALSADGRFIAFQSRGVALDGGAVTATRRHVYVLDTCFGAAGCTRTFTRATVALDGSEAAGFPIHVAISADGRHVGFASYGATWTADTNPDDWSQALVRDTCIGAAGCTPATTAVSAVGGAASNGKAYGATLSADGRFVAFTSKANNLVVNDSNGRFDVFVRDRCLGAVGCSPSVRRVSVSSAAVEGTDDSGTDDGNLDQAAPWIAADGSLASFSSKAGNLAATTDSNTAFDVYVAGTGYPE